MKRILISVLIVAAAVDLFYACSSGGASSSNITKAVGSPDYDYRTDWAKCGLLGMVKTVQHEGYSLVFSREGKMDDNDDPTTRFRGRVRTDVGYSGYTKYTFDELGRRSVQESDGYTATFTYEGDNFYPSSMVEQLTDEYDGTTQTLEHQYTYAAKDFDEAGNWLVRKDNGEKESRTIEYYEDPYALKKEIKYNTPREVAEAMLKASRNLDAEAYYATISYKDRKKMQITLEEQKNMFERISQNEAMTLRSFKIREVVMKDDNTAEVKVDEVHGDGSEWDYSHMMVKGDDGFWYNAGFGGGKQK